MNNRLLEYDPDSNKWAELAPMKYSKYRCSAVALNGEIYVLGENWSWASLIGQKYYLCQTTFVSL